MTIQIEGYFARDATKRLMQTISESNESMTGKKYPDRTPDPRANCAADHSKNAKK